MKYRIEHAGKVFDVEVDLVPDGCVVRGPDGQPQLIAFEVRADGSKRAFTPWGQLELLSVRRGEELWAHVVNRRLQARAVRVRPSGNAALGASAGAVHAPMAGRLLRVDVRVGDSVRPGQPLAVIEAMKMENELISPIRGVVTQLAFEAPATLEKGALILQIEPA
jgi:biotin carboxyl carrier protein